MGRLSKKAIQEKKEARNKYLIVLALQSLAGAVIFALILFIAISESGMIEILEKYSVNAIDIFDDGSAEFILGYLEALNFVSKTAFSDSKSKESPYTPYFLSIHDNVVANLDLYFDMVAELQSVNYFELYIKTYNTDIREIKKEVFADLKKILNEHPK